VADQTVQVIQPAEFAAPLDSLDTELANARRLVAQHGADLHYVHAWKRWLVWDGRRWARDETAEVERRAKQTVRTIYEEAAQAEDSGTRKALSKWAAASETRTAITNMVALAASEPGIPVTPSQLDRDPWLLNVANGTINLKTGDLRPHNREDLITRLAPVEYDPTADAPTWLAFQERVLPSEDLRIFVQRAVGYSLTGDTGEQVVFLCHGVGANGKTTHLETTSRTLGDYAMRTDFGSFLARDRDTGPRNDLARLAGARFVSAVEVESGRRFSEVTIKELTGGDTVTARFLYGEHFEFVPRFKVWLAANHKPVIRGTDIAIWRRVRLVPFAVTIPNNEQDRQLPDKLRAELPGILAWAVRGCLDWQRHGLAAPPEVVGATEAYREEMDPLAGFIDERCVVADTVKAKAGDLYASYSEWCNGDRPMSKRAFGQALDERGFDSAKLTAGARYWLGIGLLDR
jgi:putative DNA primase/helicase